ncbi:DNA-binding HxlR family transcriptional regulator [Weissella uvarum]|uniref:winged helix-turn-helix transcriptional regulator n=1 Tax=Weissella uvarum TaxID=1479233 RepID=UPI00196110E7|nr:helix-turn-helix domain-containing protein [Weissella uvarum]MBM7616644.1 DNA-binding HxlR family transcriptional regulator [Weissella uvarum]MCM0594898.1 helix-turn-helix transcriptional regulator [Weissella uvarum]
MADNTATAPENVQICDKFAATFEILGRKWNGLIIESLLNNGTMRFKDLSQTVVKCSDRVLVERLKELEANDIVERRTYDDSSLIEYALTKKGESMRNMMEVVHEWSDKWNADCTAEA